MMHTLHRYGTRRRARDGLMCSLIKAHIVS